MSTAVNLDNLAGRIRDEIAAANASARDFLAHAIEAGHLLTEAKKKVRHGEWLPWLEANCDLSIRQAQNYMRLAEKVPALTEANTQRVSHLSIRGAIDLLTDHRESDERPQRASQIGRHTAIIPATVNCEAGHFILTSYDDNLERAAEEAEIWKRELGGGNYEWPVVRPRLPLGSR